ncbi:hypothetical protein CYLTODRAFT_98900 [Cylindrobasidium torrendii FP15055 ss-10]|uniref:Sulfhydryl oxidase n=1 Tax=Cylindrobasidium torrendii FP15055 ss-10 TaxID=1314674 RepID=A0A0D7BNQ0_9AGAR|nr:hypothetical protein CYLTODRAFT_98900 [Cylindrobasidium torrendii FP15055 ss-10]
MAKIISRFAKSFFAVIAALFLLATVLFFHPPMRAYIDPWTGDVFGEGGVEQYFKAATPTEKVHSLNKGSVHGEVIMPKLGNATAKAALGRATWKLLHTMTLRYPETPSPDEREALDSYFHLLSRLYPCGECAAEFQQLLAKYPPQTSSRKAASLWLCDVHNKVNKRLGHAQFDCAHLDAEYDCGCGDEPIINTKEPDDMENELPPDADELTGVKMIKGGR